MAKRIDGRANNGGSRPNSGPRVKDEDKKIQVPFGVKKKLVSTQEDRTRLKNAVYDFIENVYEPNLKSE